ncbi:hypothetical protein ACFV4N_40105 [Actinosynnema sp. NPDC059797]
MKSALGLLALVASLLTGCGVTAQDEPQPLVTSQVVPAPTPTLTQRPDPTTPTTTSTTTTSSATASPTTTATAST